MFRLLCVGSRLLLEGFVCFLHGLAYLFEGLVCLLRSLACFFLTGGVSFTFWGGRGARGLVYLLGGLFLFFPICKSNWSMVIFCATRSK